MNAHRTKRDRSVNSLTGWCSRYQFVRLQSVLNISTLISGIPKVFCLPWCKWLPTLRPVVVTGHSIERKTKYPNFSMKSRTWLNYVRFWQIFFNRCSILTSTNFIGINHNPGSKTVYSKTEEKSSLVAKWPLIIFLLNYDVVLIFATFYTVIFEMIPARSDPATWYAMYKLRYTLLIEIVFFRHFSWEVKLIYQKIPLAFHLTCTHCTDILLTWLW